MTGNGIGIVTYDGTQTGQQRSLLTLMATAVDISSDRC